MPKLETGNSYQTLPIIDNGSKSANLYDGGYTDTTSLEEIRAMEKDATTTINCLATTTASQGEAMIWDKDAYVFHDDGSATLIKEGENIGFGEAHFCAFKAQTERDFKELDNLSNLRYQIEHAAFCPEGESISARWKGEVQMMKLHTLSHQEEKAGKLFDLFGKAVNFWYFSAPDAKNAQYSGTSPEGKEYIEKIQAQMSKDEKRFNSRITEKDIVFVSNQPFKVKSITFLGNESNFETAGENTRHWHSHAIIERDDKTLGGGHIDCTYNLTNVSLEVQRMERDFYRSSPDAEFTEAAGRYNIGLKIAKEACPNKNLDVQRAIAQQFVNPTSFQNRTKPLHTYDFPAFDTVIRNLEELAKRKETLITEVSNAVALKDTLVKSICK